MWYPVSLNNELSDGGMTRVSVEGTDVLLLKSKSRFDAFYPICCHGGAPLEQGYRVDGCLVCPWHRSTFNTTSGRVIAGPARHRLKRIPCKSGRNSVEIWLDCGERHEFSLTAVTPESDLARLRQNGTRQSYIRLENGLKLRLRHDLSMTVDDIDILDEVFKDNLYRIDELVSGADLIIDIGAQAGFFSLLCASLPHNPTVLAYEPQCDNFGALTENVALNPHLNVQAFQLAVSDIDGEIEFFSSDWNTGGHSMIVGKIRERVPSVTLQSILDAHGLDRVPVLKIDCEGGEYPILLSACPETLHRFEKIVLEEHQFCGFEEKYPPNAIDEKLSASGFRVSTIMCTDYPGEGKFRVLLATR